MLDKILVPTDFSNNAWKALVFAANLQKHKDLDIVILHSFLPFYTGFQSPRENQEQYDAGYQISLGRMKSLEEQIKKELPELKYSVIIKDGTLYNAIQEVRKDENVSAICMGTKGASGLQATIIGSQTYEVAKRIDLPIMIIPESYEFKDNKEVVFLTNFEDNDTFSIQIVKELIQPETINFVHFARVVPSETIDKELENHISKLDLQSVTTKTTLVALDEFESPEGIRKVINDNGWSLIAINPMQRGFFDNLFSKSFSKPLIHASNVPILLAKTR